MISSQDSDEILSRLLKEHELIDSYTKTLQKYNNEGDKSQLQTHIVRLIDFFETDLIKHFAIEERYIFPAILLNSPSLENIGTTLKLTNAHGALTLEAENINDALKVTLENEQAISNQLSEHLQGFMEKLKGHAQEEMQTLYPMVSRSPQTVTSICSLLKSKK